MHDTLIAHKGLYDERRIVLPKTSVIAFEAKGLGLDIFRQVHTLIDHEKSRIQSIQLRIEQSTQKIQDLQYQSTQLQEKIHTLHQTIQTLDERLQNLHMQSPDVLQA